MRDGDLMVSGRPLDQQELLSVFKQASANNPGRQTVLIRAPTSCLRVGAM